MFQNVKFAGTAKDFVDAEVSINGRAVDAVSLGGLAKHNVVVFKGYGQKPARGKTPTIYGADSRDGFVVNIKNTANIYQDEQGVYRVQHKPTVVSKALDTAVNTLMTISQTIVDQSNEPNESDIAIASAVMSENVDTVSTEVTSVDTSESVSDNQDQ